MGILAGYFFAVDLLLLKARLDHRKVHFSYLFIDILRIDYYFLNTEPAIF